MTRAIRVICRGTAGRPHKAGARETLVHRLYFDEDLECWQAELLRSAKATRYGSSDGGQWFMNGRSVFRKPMTYAGEPVETQYEGELRYQYGLTCSRCGLNLSRDARFVDPVLDALCAEGAEEKISLAELIRKTTRN